MWEKVKFITSEMGSFLWPLIKQFLVASAPAIRSAAIAAVRYTASKYGVNASNDVKHNYAYDTIIKDLKHQGLQLGRDFTESMIDTAIASAVRQLK